MPPPGPALPPFSRSLPMQLLRAREAVMQRFRPHLRGHDMTDQQWRVVRVLALGAERDTVLRLARRMQVSDETARRLLRNIDLLEARYTQD